MGSPKNLYRTWIEIDRHKLRQNISEFLTLLKSGTEFMAVVKSNAYGHGIVDMTKAISTLFLKSRKHGLWFGVDSIVEAVRLRKEGIREPMLVLGYTLPLRMKEASSRGISITISSFDSLERVAGLKKPISIHLKFDTGMHRQGFFKEDISEILDILKHSPNIKLEGVYTHFAMAKDPKRPTFTKQQHTKFSEITKVLRRLYPNIIVHSSASGASLLFPKMRPDMVRIGIGLYGYYPSSEARLAMEKKVKLHPILSWRSQISEIKKIPKGDSIGYDRTETVKRSSAIAVVPIGYWHGYDRGLSSKGRVLVRGRIARVLGRVSMDMITIDVTGIPDVEVGDTVTIIGKDGANAVTADDIGAMIGTSSYEVLTRINPLIHKEY